jgi:hypothetical protein
VSTTPDAKVERYAVLVVVLLFVGLLTAAFISHFKQAKVVEHTPVCEECPDCEGQKEVQENVPEPPASEKLFTCYYKYWDEECLEKKDNSCLKRGKCDHDWMSCMRKSMKRQISAPNSWRAEEMFHVLQGAETGEVECIDGVD